MNEIELIKRYLNNINTSYSLLINGPWGSGKTYYWNNIIVPTLIEESHGQKNNGFKPIYISLYGLENHNDIGKLILYQLIPVNKKNQIINWIATIGSKLSTSVASFFNINDIKINPKDLKNISKLKNCLIAFDDIERITPIGNIEKVLGYINYLSEHESMKIIILTNEDMLKNNLPKWNIIKEKVVSEQIEFKPDYKKVIASIISDYKTNAEYFCFLNTNVQLIQTSLCNSGTDNLRSLKYALERYNYFYLAERDNEELQEFQSALFYSCLCISFEYKLGKISPNDDKQIKQLPNHISDNDLLLKEIDNPEQKNNYSIVFYKKYYSNHKLPFLISSKYYDFILDGIVNSDVSNEIINKYKPAKIDSKEVEALNTLQSLSINAVEETNLKELVDIVIVSANKGKYSVMYYPIILKTFKNLIEYNIVNMEVEEIEDIIETGLNMHIQSGIQTYIPFIEQHLDESFFQDKKLQVLRNKVIRYNNIALKKKIKQEIHTAISERSYDIVLEMIYPSGTYKDLNSFFEYIEIEQFTDFIEHAPNSFILETANRIIGRYNHNNFKNEYKYLEVLKKNLDTLNQNLSTGIKTFYINKIIMSIVVVLSDGKLSLGEIDDSFV